MQNIELTEKVEHYLKHENLLYRVKIFGYWESTSI